jgi:antitoxin HicB
MTLRYPIKLTLDDNGTLMVTCPLLPEVTSFGDDEADAMRHAVNAVEEALAARIDDGMDIPAPPARMPSARSRASVARRRRALTPSRTRHRRTVELPLMTALKVALYRALRETGITRAELMRRLGWNRESVDRLFRLDHASRLDQIEAAFKALGRRVDLSIERAA